MTDNAETVAVETDDTVVKGLFAENLKRSNSKIRKDRAEAIAEDAETIFRRTVEDIRIKVKRLKRDRENLLDLSPTNAQSLMVASDFEAEEFVKKDLAIGLEIRNQLILLEIAEDRYNQLFS